MHRIYNAKPGSLVAKDRTGRGGKEGADLSFQEQLLQILTKEQIRMKEPMSRHTTFRTGGPADYYLTPEIGQAAKVLALCRREGIPVEIIGNGSNLLVGDKGIRGAVVEIGQNAAEVYAQGTTLYAQAGASLAKAAQEAARASLGGLEFASGIPGTVGGAVVMNAGAYGGEMKHVLKWAKVLLPEGRVEELSVQELELSYRHSLIQDLSGVVLEAAFSLKQEEEDLIRAQMEVYRNQRSQKQPLEYPSAGSTFKRPEGHYAGALIEQCGLKGLTVGGAQVSEKHAGFLINRGGASSGDVLELIRQVRERVLAETGVRLEPEVRILD